MDESAEWYREKKSEGKARRERNRESSAALLKRKGVGFTEHNNGAHLVVDGHRGKVDFWPGTGKWIARNGVKGRGVFNMLRAIERKKV